MPDPSQLPAATRAMQAFAARFGGRPAALARAPGRVNLVGEHVDYADGCVLPVAADLDCVAAVRPATDGRWRIWSDDLRSLAELPDPSDPRPLAVGDAAWSNLALGVLAGFVREGVRVPPLELAVASDVPIGAGLSSSAAFAVALGTAIAEALSAPLFGLPLARLCQEAESAFRGVPCGMMDPVTSALARAGHALLVDCRTLDVRFVPFPPDDRAQLLVFDSGVHRSLGDGRYAERRREVEDAARALRVASLRDVDEAALRNARLPDLLERRGDLDVFGLFMAQGHQSLRDDFAVSTPELDAIVDEARSVGTPGGVFGARMTGAGFGGSVIVLADAAHPGLGDRIATGVVRRLGRRLAWRRVRPSAGAAAIPAARWPGA